MAMMGFVLHLLWLEFKNWLPVLPFLCEDWISYGKQEGFCWFLHLHAGRGQSTPLWPSVWPRSLIWSVRMAEDGQNVHHLGRGRVPLLCSWHAGQTLCRMESELHEQLMSRNQLDTSEGSRLEKHSNLAKQSKILRYLAKSWVNTTGKYSFD